MTAIITGASRGIGRETARLFALRGASVVINYLHSEKEARTLCEELEGFPVMAARADVRDAEQAKRLVCRASERFGFVDMLVNNAGISEQSLFCDITPEQWRDMFAVHLDGAYHCCRAALPAMLREHRGAIVNVASIWGAEGASCEVHYSAAKAALIGMTKALSKELGPSGIRVNCVAPGAIETDMLASFSREDLDDIRGRTPLLRLGTAREVAEVIWFLASDAASFVTGQVLGVDGGFR